jgi:hypothetical protein
MFEYIPWGTKSHHNKLKSSIYHTFRKEILPYLNISILSKHFSNDTGRATKDLQSVMGLFIIQALKNMTDEEAIEAFCFNDAFRYALDIHRDEYISERAYYYYRAKLLGEEEKIFDSVLKRIADRINLNTAIQREDSTLVRTWLKSMSKLDCFSTTINKFLKEIKETHPIIFSRINEDIRTKYFSTKDDQRWFGSKKPDEYQKCLVEAAKDVLSLLGQFDAHPKVSKLESYALLKRLADEQITEDSKGITVKVKPEAKGTAMANPHDPDAHYNGHRKKVGYKADFIETCGPDKDTPNPKIITNVEVTKANVADSKIIEDVVDKLEEKGLKPEKLLADNGYDSDAIQQNLRQKGVELICPPSGDFPDGFSLLDFKISESGKEIVKCPMGQSCLENKISKNRKETSSYFNRETCGNCPHSHDCPVKITRRKAKVVWKWNKPRIEARRLMFNDDEEIKSLYRQRSGGEAPFSIAKRVLGLERTRRRGFARNKMVIFLAATALNVLRMHLWVHLPGKLHRFFIILRNFWLNFVHFWQKVMAENDFVIAS